MKRLWQKALSKGVCPFGGCEIKTQVCMHLDKYLNYTPKTYTDPKTGGVKRGSNHLEVRLLYTDDVDEFMTVPDLSEKPVEGIWAVFKKIRHYGLARDQVGILVRIFGAGMNHRQVLDDMGWTSMSSLFRRYNLALKVLKQRGFGGSK